MHKKILLIGIIFILSCINSIAQDTVTKLIIGETINNKFEPVGFVNVKALGVNNGTISNEQGKFQIKVKISDTLFFSSIRHKNLKISVKMLNKDYNYITLHEQIYELEQVDIMEARWQDFKYNMMNIELKPTERAIVVIEGLPDPYMKLTPVKISPISNPATFLFEYFKKESIRKRKQKRWRNIYEKSQIEVK